MPTFALTNPVPGSSAAAAAAGGLQTATLESGNSYQIGTGLTTAAGAVNTPQTPTFTLQPRGDGGDRTLNITAVPTPAAGTITTLTVNLLVSYDNGNTWQIYASSGAMGGAGIPSAQFKNVVAGGVYSLAVATLTLGTATSFNLDGSLS